jgi:hypothetical protein
MAIGTVKLSAEHAAVFEIYGLSGTGKDRCDRAFL